MSHSSPIRLPKLRDGLSPSLPFDVLHEVRRLGILGDLDELACSLVSLTWHAAFSPGVDKHPKIAKLKLDATKPEWIKRLVALLVESSRLGLGHVRTVNSITIKMDNLFESKGTSRAYRSEVEDLFVSVFAVGLAIDKLDLMYNNVPKNPPPDLCRLRSFLRRIQPFCGSVHMLHVTDRFCPPYEPLNAPRYFLNDFIRTLSNTTTSLGIDHVRPEDGFIEAIKSRHSLNYLLLCGLSNNTLLNLLHHSWPNLRGLAIICGEDLLNRVLSMIARHLPRLDRLTIAGTRYHVALDPLAHLIHRCDGLVHLSLVGIDNLDDAFITRVAGTGRSAQLRRLRLRRCGAVTGVRARISGWERLEEVLIDGCDGIAPVFLGELVTSCPKMRNVSIEGSLVSEEEFVQELVRRGFVLDEGSWKREGRGRR